MNGDFFALLPKAVRLAGDGGGRVFATATHAAPGGAVVPPVLEATTVFAFHCAAGVIMAGDHRATAGNIVFSDRTEKILELDRHSLLAIAGSPAIAMEMARTLRTSFDFYRRSQLQPMSLPAKMRALARLLHDNVPAALQGFGMVAPIFAGADPATGGRPCIYFYDPLGAQFEAASFAGSGSGAGSIKSVLHFLQQWGDPKPENMPLERAVTLANQLLMTAAEYDTATGGVDPAGGEFATIKLLETTGGIRTITSQEQATFWRTQVPS